MELPQEVMEYLRRHAPGLYAVARVRPEAVLARLEALGEGFLREAYGLGVAAHGV